MQENTRTRRLKFLPRIMEQVIGGKEQEAEEIRMRIGSPLVLTLEGENLSLPLIVTQELLQEVINRATSHSLYAFQESLQQGFLTVQGGHRIGFCGSVILKEGRIQGFRTVSSLNIRLAAQRKGVGDFCISHILGNNTLILSPPGCGKTTLLRDLVRQLSEMGARVCVADERSEICGMYQGMPQFDIGPNTDVMDGCPKAVAAVMMMKAMSPDYLVMDEILSRQDVQAVEYASHGGAQILLSAHGLSYEDFRRKQLFVQLMKSCYLNQILEIHKQDGKRIYTLRKREGERFD